MAKQKIVDAANLKDALKDFCKTLSSTNERSIVYKCIDILTHMPEASIEWKSVKYELPKCYETVLCRHVFDNNETIICENTYTRAGIWLFCTNNVTHWARVNFR